MKNSQNTNNKADGLFKPSASNAPSIEPCLSLLQAFNHQTGQGNGSVRAVNLNTGVLRSQGVLITKFDGRSIRRRIARDTRKQTKKNGGAI